MALSSKSVTTMVELTAFDSHEVNQRRSAVSPK